MMDDFMFAYGLGIATGIVISILLVRFGCRVLEASNE